MTFEQEDLLDNYLTNKLQPEARQAFEKQLEADPSLRDEVALQQKIAESLKTVRKAELKAMLNAVPIAPVNPLGTSVLLKYAAGALLTLSAGTGLYYYFSSADPSVYEVKLSSDILSETHPELSVEKQVPPDETTNSEGESHSALKEKTSNSVGQPAVETPQDPKASVYDPFKEEKEENEVKNEVDLSFGTDSKTPLVLEVETYQHKEFTRHYQLNNGKLILYGTFHKDLFAIIEFIHEDQRTAYLYYNSSYYGLNKKADISPLIPVADQQLIRKLEEVRKK
jgi:hypothetical protein